MACLTPRTHIWHRRSEPLCIAFLIALSSGFLWTLFVRNGNGLFLGDGYIFLRYAENLAGRHEWAFNPGEPSYATSSVTWAIVLGLLKVCVPTKPAFVAASAFLGGCFFMASAALFWQVLRACGIRTGVRLAIAGFYTLWPFTGVAYAISAMETGLFLFLFQLAVWLWLCLEARPSRSRITALSVTLSLLSLTRPEGVILCALLPMYSFFSGRCLGKRIDHLLLSGLGAAPLALWLAWSSAKFGTLLPTSAKGRVYGYLATALPDISLRQYQQLSLFGRLSNIPRVLQTQFLGHPVVLVTCLVPAIAAVTLYFALSREGRRPLAPLVAFVALDLIGYLLFQPLVFQRYLVCALPIGLWTFAAWIDGKWAELPKPSGRLALLSLAIVLALSARVFVPYYRTGAEQNRAIAELFRGFAEGRERDDEPVAMAAEPIGLAAYFTDARVVDTGGLLDPGLWSLWLEMNGDRVPFPGLGGDASLLYAVRQGATHLYGQAGLSPPPGYRVAPVAGPDAEERMIFKLETLAAQPGY